MLISFIIYINTPDYKGQINRILKSLKGVNYPKKQMEVIIYAKAANASRVYKIEGPPLVRILPDDNINNLIQECHGDIVFLIDERFKFPPDFFKNKSTSRVYVGKGYCNIRKLYFYPDDVKCLRTASIMQAVVSKQKVHGKWEKLNRKEILRYIYRWDEISKWNKFKVILGYARGK